jgi:hypothetical protein
MSQSIPTTLVSIVLADGTRLVWDAYLVATGEELEFVKHVEGFIGPADQYIEP